MYKAPVHWINKIIVVFTITLFLFIGGCGESDSGGSDSISIDEPNTLDGFTTAYLNGKTFYRPFSYSSTNAIRTYKFTHQFMTRTDPIFDEVHAWDYKLVDYDDIYGIIEYENVYTCHLRVIEVTEDYIGLCYAYQGLESLMTCEETEMKFFYEEAKAIESFEDI